MLPETPQYFIQFDNIVWNSEYCGYFMSMIDSEELPVNWSTTVKAYTIDEALDKAKRQIQKEVMNTMEEYDTRIRKLD